MGAFHGYPYTNFHDLNLDWVIELLKKFETELTQFEGLNTIKYANPFQWDITRQYAQNTLVIDPETGTTYLSVQPVPQGVQITNTEYWTPVADISHILQQIIDAITSSQYYNFGLPATKKIEIGELVWINDKLYICKSVVDEGQNITVSAFEYTNLDAEFQRLVNQNNDAIQTAVATLNSRISNIIANGQQTEGNTELIDIRTWWNGNRSTTAGDAVRGQISDAFRQSQINFDLSTSGTHTLDMGWVQGYWYSIVNGQYGAATPDGNYVACSTKIVGNGATLKAVKADGLGLSLYVCVYDIGGRFIQGYQYGNTSFEIALEVGKMYAFSVFSSQGVTPTSAAKNYVFTEIYNKYDVFTELIDIRTWWNGNRSTTAGDAVRGQISDAFRQSQINFDLSTSGTHTLDMGWVQGYWYSIVNGQYGAATPDGNYVACSTKIVGNGATLKAVKADGLGLSLYVCVYDIGGRFIQGYQYGNTSFEIALEVGKMYAFSVFSSQGVTPTSAAKNYVFTEIYNKYDVFYVGPTRKYTKLKDVIEAACAIQGSTVYVDSAVYDVVEEYGSAYFQNYTYSTNNCGIVLKNGVRVIFSPGATVLCNYTGSNSDVMKYFSPFNVGPGGFTLENLNIKCSRVRYCVHDDLAVFGNSQNYIKTEYQNCNMFIDNSLNTAWTKQWCIGGGLPYNGKVIINGCIFKSTAENPTYGGVMYHQNGTTGAKSTSLITNCYFAGPMDYYACSNLGQTNEISDVVVTNCSTGRTIGYANNPEYTNSINFLSWNNIRRPDIN